MRRALKPSRSVVVDLHNVALVQVVDIVVIALVVAVGELNLLLS